MYKILMSLLLIVFATQASANRCPSFYRFVDFGLEDRDGIIRRGGTIFRAFDSDGKHLLVPERTVCLSVDEVSKDGRALAIPVVSSIDINPEAAAIDFTELRLAAIDDVVAVAEANAALHLEKLTRAGTITTRGDDFLCASTAEVDALSCQVLSPYEGNIAPIIYCDAQQCEMQVLVRDEQLIVSAVWSRNATDPEAVGFEVSNKLKQIHDFLGDQS